MGNEGTFLNNALTFLLLAMLPFTVVVCTSFARIAIVLNMLRSAFGTPGVPPASVLMGISVVMTVFIMTPVFQETMHLAEQETPQISAAEDNPVEKARTLYTALSPPLLRFLRANTPAEEIAWVSELAGATPAELPDLRVLLMAFASSEFIRALSAGLLLLLPFMLVDLLVANTLMATGLTTLSAMAISLPLKLLLFIAADGWTLLMNALILSYTTP